MIARLLTLAWPAALALITASAGAALAASTLPDGVGIEIGGVAYNAQNSGRPWSLASEEGGALRFEVRSGDRWRNDPPTRERSEISGPVYLEGVPVTVEYDFMIEPGSPNTARDMILGQFHADDPITSPPFAIRLRGEKLRINVAWAGAQPQSKLIFRDSEDIERGRYYRMRVEVRFAPDGDGYARVWRDGKPIADYRGPMGYGYGVYWKQGIYRPAAKEPIVIRYRNLTVTDDVAATEAELPTVR